MRRRMVMAGLAASGAVVGGFALWPRPLPATPALPVPTAPMPAYHLGHSLVGRDMPAMLAQMAGHSYASQLGWGASLMQHATGDIPGFDVENAHPAHQPATESLASGRYAAVILTEMVELREALRWHDSARYLAHWAQAAQQANPTARVYLYETWHRLDDPDGWLLRIDSDLKTLWTDQLLIPAMRRSQIPIYLIPAGQILAAATRAIESGQIPGLTNRTDLFARTDGTPDPIHLNDTGHYLVALTHFATLYHRSPQGLPHDLRRADGTAMTPLAQSAALALQQLVWQTVPRYAATGLARSV